MNKTDVTKFFSNLKTEAAKKSPEILIGVGIASGITATVLAVRATPKALRLLEDAEYDKGAPLTAGEKVKAGWKPYIPAVAATALSVGAIVGSNKVTTKRITAITTAYKLSETALSEYKAKVVETLGEKKEQVIRDKVAKDKMEKHPFSTSNVIIANDTKTLCFDAQFNQYFTSDIETIRRAINNINYRLMSEEYVSLNDFYDEIDSPDLGHIGVGDDLGWNMGKDGMIDIHFTSQLTDNGKPCVVLEYTVAPRYNYHKLI